MTKWFALGLVLLFSGCSDASADATSAPQAAEVKGQTCAVCGMSVSEQPGPHAQVVHRDGERAFICSASEVKDYVHAPSPHGPPTAVFIEALPPNVAPSAIDASPRPYVDARSAFFVVDGPARKVMGESILSYRSRAQAEAVSGRYGGAVVDYSQLLTRTAKARSKAAANPEPDISLDGADVAHGKKIYTEKCVACHQADGKAMGGMLGANFVDDKSFLAKTNRELLHSIAEGKQGKSSAMPPWKNTLDEQSRKDALAYIRSAFGQK